MIMLPTLDKKEVAKLLVWIAEKLTLSVNENGTKRKALSSFYSFYSLHSLLL